MRNAGLNSLCQLTDEEINQQCREIANHKNVEVEKRVEIIRQKALDNIRHQEQEFTPETTTIEAGTAVQLRGAKISQELAKILDSAKHQVLIYSPWISAGVVNDRFVKRLQKLATKGVWILIGYGIAKSEEAEDRKVPKKVKEKLSAVLTPEGIPAVQFFWLGGSHAKELIVDRGIHLLGSNNLLSFRASSGLWDESVYKVTILEQVRQAYEFYARRFEDKAQELWNDALKNKNIELATQAFCLWGALGMEEIAFERVQISDWKELYPVWIQIVKQGIRAKKILPDSACFQKLKDLEQSSNQYSTDNFKEADNIYEKKNDTLVTEINKISSCQDENDQADEYVIGDEESTVNRQKACVDLKQMSEKAIQISNEADAEVQQVINKELWQIEFEEIWQIEQEIWQIEEEIWEREHELLQREQEELSQREQEEIWQIEEELSQREQELSQREQELSQIKQEELSQREQELWRKQEEEWRKQEELWNKQEEEWRREEEEEEWRREFEHERKQEEEEQRREFEHERKQEEEEQRREQEYEALMEEYEALMEECKALTEEEEERRREFEDTMVLDRLEFEDTMVLDRLDWEEFEQGRWEEFEQERWKNFEQEREQEERKFYAELEKMTERWKELKQERRELEQKMKEQQPKDYDCFNIY